MNGTKLKLPDTIVMATYSSDALSTVGISNATVMRSVTRLAYVESLQKIAKLYHSDKKTLDSIKESLEIATNARNMILNTGKRLNSKEFNGDASVLASYIRLLAKEASYSEQDITSILNNNMLDAKQVKYDLSKHLSILVNEINSNIKTKDDIVILYSGVKYNSTPRKLIEQVVNSFIVSHITSNTKFKVIDTENTELFNHLSANFIFKGSLVHTSSRTLIFGQLIKKDTAQILSAPQVVINNNDEIRELMVDL